MAAVKLLPQFLSWTAILLILMRGFAGSRRAMAVASAAGYAGGVAGALVLFHSFPGDGSFGIIRTIVGVAFLLFWGIAVTAVYRSTVRDFPLAWAERVTGTPVFFGACAFLTGMTAGAISACRIAGSENAVLTSALVVLVAIALIFAVKAVERVLPPSFTISGPGIAAAVVALLLFCSSSLLRLDLFSPLSMKVMKFTHDFVHQFFESMLIPDHLFIRSNLWGYIGLLFSKEVGFWGALIIWFTPVVLVLLAIRWERLPSVAHIRQGAQRRKMLAAAIRGRRYRLVIPLIALAVLAAAVYQSRFPAVEYWDPKPLVVTASPAGEIFIPKKGEVDLEDGKLHKFLFKQGGKEARFFVLMTPAGELAVALDACAICRPDGYGQTEGTIICYYCKTLIPLETVGKPGGCNPVPVPFAAKEDGIHINGLTLVNTWSNTVQATARVKEGPK